jgi:hypothetical protein
LFHQANVSVSAVALADVGVAGKLDGNCSTSNAPALPACCWCHAVQNATIGDRDRLQR